MTPLPLMLIDPAMKTMLRTLSCLVIFAAAVAVLPGAGTPEMPAAGKFLVLRNGRTLEGDIQLVEDSSGAQYRVRRNGGETFIPAKLVLRLFLDTEQAYQFMRGKANLNDPDERFCLAQWCLNFNLRRQAEEEASVALLLRPNDKETKQLLELHPSGADAPDHRPSDVPPPSPQAAETDTLRLKAVELTPEALGHFTHKVQPVLINACASCHASSRTNSFKLMRTSDVPTLNQRATQVNLAAVLAQINYVQPQASPLLTKAVNIHGGSGQAPLKGRQTVPYQTLEDWLRLTLATNPQLRERPGDSVVPPPAPLAPPTTEVKSAFAETNVDTPPQNSVPTACRSRLFRRRTACRSRRS